MSSSNQLLLVCTLLAGASACGGSGSGDNSDDSTTIVDARVLADAEASNPDTAIACIDNDNDTYGIGCAAGPDCNDNDESVHPNAVELCDGAIDHNCTDGVDDGCSDVPFEVASCEGPALTSEQALLMLGDSPRRVLSESTIQLRTRDCAGPDEESCSMWAEPSDWVTRFLTWSGGTQTRYLSLLAETRLVLFKNQANQPQLSLQHVTFTAPGSQLKDTDGILYSLPPTPIQYPVYHAWNIDPATQYDYMELDWTVKNGTLVVGPNCARFTAIGYSVPQPNPVEYAVLFRWASSP